MTKYRTENVRDRKCQRQPYRDCRNIPQQKCDWVNVQRCRYVPKKQCYQVKKFFQITGQLYAYNPGTNGASRVGDLIGCFYFRFRTSSAIKSTERSRPAKQDECPSGLAGTTMVIGKKFKLCQETTLMTTAIVTITEVQGRAFLPTLMPSFFLRNNSIEKY